MQGDHFLCERYTDYTFHNRANSIAANYQRICMLISILGPEKTLHIHVHHSIGQYLHI